MSLESEFENNLNDFLKDKMAPLIDYFERIIEKGTLSSVLDYVFHIASVGKRCPIVSHTVAGPFDVEDTIIPSDFYLDKKYTEIEDKVWQITTEQFFNWFHACWIKAGGQDYLGNAYIQMDDDNDSLDLKSGDWISDQIRVDR